MVISKIVVVNNESFLSVVISGEKEITRLVSVLEVARDNCLLHSDAEWVDDLLDKIYTQQELLKNATR